MACRPLLARPQGVEHCSREDRICLVGMPSSVEDEHHLLLDSPGHSHISQQYRHLKTFRLGFIAFLAVDPLTCYSPQNLFCTKTICDGQSIGSLGSDL